MIRSILLVVIILLVSCSADVAGPITERGASASASYKATFTADLNSADYPTNFPRYPYFSGLVGVAHSEQVKFWEPGQLASAGIRQVAELGDKSVFLDEIAVAKYEGSAEFMISGNGISLVPGLASLEFDINKTYPRVTLASMLGPSPDWFVGVRDLNLFDNEAGVWKDSVSVDLILYDAGTDNGRRYTSEDSEAQSPRIIAALTSEAGDTDFIDGLQAATGKPIGRMLFTRVR